MNTQEISAINADRLGRWADRLDDAHCTAMILIGIGHDDQAGLITLCTPEGPDVMNRALGQLLSNVLAMLNEPSTPVEKQGHQTSTPRWPMALRAMTPDELEAIRARWAQSDQAEGHDIAALLDELRRVCLALASAWTLLDEIGRDCLAVWGPRVAAPRIASREPLLALALESMLTRVDAELHGATLAVANARTGANRTASARLVQAATALCAALRERDGHFSPNCGCLTCRLEVALKEVPLERRDEDA